MLNQIQIDQLTAEQYSSFLSDEKEFCEDANTDAGFEPSDLYTNEDLGYPGDSGNHSHGVHDWIGSLVSTMYPDMTFGTLDEHYLSTVVRS